MCGIFGVQGVPGAASIVHLGLYSLQHRGQESAGIVAIDDDGTAHVARKMGLVSDGFDGPTVGSPHRKGKLVGATPRRAAPRDARQNARLDPCPKRCGWDPWRSGS